MLNLLNHKKNCILQKPTVAKLYYFYYCKIGNMIFQTKKKRFSNFRLEISSFRFNAGIVIGILYAFCWYIFSCWVMESLLLFSYSNPGSPAPWLLSDSDRQCWKWFFAALGYVLGQCRCFEFWLDQPRHFFQKYHYRKTSILLEQRNLNWYFLAGFSKVVFLFTYFFSVEYKSGFVFFDIKITTYIILSLCIVVLFLHTWLSFRKVFPSLSKKWMSISALGLFLFSFLLSGFDFFDQFSPLNVPSQSTKKYHLDLPEISNQRELLYDLSIYQKLYVFSAQDSIRSNRPILRGEYHEISHKNLSTYLKDLKLKTDPRNHPFIHILLYANKNIPFQYIKSIEDSLEKNYINKIMYIGLPKGNSAFQQFYYNNEPSYYITKTLPPNYLKPTKEEVKNLKNSTWVSIKEKGYYIDSLLTPTSKLLETLIQKSNNNSANYIILKTDLDISFQKYITFRDAFQVLQYLHRNQQSISVYNKKYPNLTIEEKRNIRGQFPLILLEQ